MQKMETASEQQPLLFGKKIAAIKLGVCVRSVDNLIRRGEIVSVLVGRRRLIPAAALENFIKKAAR
jgi:excisionase family DNA binding protein